MIASDPQEYLSPSLHDVEAYHEDVPAIHSLHRRRRPAAGPGNPSRTARSSVGNREPIGRGRGHLYYPKNTSKKVPTILVRTPYNFNFWDVRLGAPRDMSQVLEAVKRGYAWVDMNERGHFFSEGNYDILGPPTTDGSDAISWMASQPWSNGKVERT